MTFHSKRLAVYALVVLGTLSFVRGDYPCFCNYDVEIKVLPSMDESANPLGYMYEFDCKEMLDNVAISDGWQAIGFEHQIGYIQKGPRFDPQMCQGEPSPDDTVTSTTLATTTPVPSTYPSTTTTPTTTTTTPAPTTPTTTTTTTTTTTPKPTTTPTTPVPTTTMPTTPSTTTTPTTTSTTTAMPITSTAMTGTTGIVSGQTNLCPANIRQHAMSGQSVLGQYGHKCYEFVDKFTHWVSAENTCTRNGGHLVQIASTEEQNYVNNFAQQNFNHPLWIGLHDRNHEEIFEWTSGDAVTYTHWTPGRKLTFSHGLEDCVYMDPRLNHLAGGWDDVECGDSLFSLFGEQHRFVCQYDITGYTAPPPTTIDPSASTQQPQGDGNINMCPARVLQNAPHYNLGQYGHYCYELVVSTKHTWDQSEAICQNHGGHLVTIANEAEQMFVSDFLNRHSPQHAVWLGLNDVNVESSFEWSSGRPVQYTNWVPGHLNNFGSHYEEDCVVFVPYKNNIWDDVPCGYHGIFDEAGEIHYAFCQFKVSTSSIIG